MTFQLPLPRSLSDIMQNDTKRRMALLGEETPEEKYLVPGIKSAVGGGISAYQQQQKLTQDAQEGALDRGSKEKIATGASEARVRAARVRQDAMGGDSLKKQSAQSADKAMQAMTDEIFMPVGSPEWTERWLSHYDQFYAKLSGQIPGSPQAAPGAPQAAPKTAQPRAPGKAAPPPADIMKAAMDEMERRKRAAQQQPAQMPMNDMGF